MVCSLDIHVADVLYKNEHQPCPRSVEQGTKGLRKDLKFCSLKCTLCICKSTASSNLTLISICCSPWYLRCQPLCDCSSVTEDRGRCYSTQTRCHIDKMSWQGESRRDPQKGGLVFFAVGWYVFVGNIWAAGRKTVCIQCKGCKVQWGQEKGGLTLREDYSCLPYPPTSQPHYYYYVESRWQLFLWGDEYIHQFILSSLPQGITPLLSLLLSAANAADTSANYTAVYCSSSKISMKNLGNFKPYHKYLIGFPLCHFCL